jgi:DNA-binding transcriptional LysR family regulator
MHVSVTLAGLRAVEALGVHGSISAAAVALGYTPSAVSQQIARLERDLHQDLIERQGRRASLTTSGTILAESARRIISELESMSARVQAESHTVTGSLTVAAFPSAARGLLPRVVGRLARRWPDLQVRAVEVSSHGAVELVLAGQADLAVAHDWHGLPMDVTEGLSGRRVGVDVSDVLVNEHHVNAALGEADIQDFATDPWLYEPGSVAQEFLAAAFRGASDGLSLGHRISEYATQVEMVAAGLGVALVPRMGRGALPPSVRVVTVRSPPLRGIHALWRSASTQRPAITATLDELESACASVP